MSGIGRRWALILVGVVLAALVLGGVWAGCRAGDAGIDVAVSGRELDSLVVLRAFEGRGYNRLIIPTAQATATPGLVIDNLAAGARSIEVRDSGTPVAYLGQTGALTVAGLMAVGDGQENINLPSVITASVTYTPASGTVATIADGEIWLVHSVFFQTTTNFDCTGNDCTLTIGDGNDADGFLALADASIQTTFTEATGFAAGFAGIENGSAGAYTTDDGGPFVYAPSGAAETIDYAVGGTDPAAGAGLVYLVYTRIQ